MDDNMEKDDRFELVLGRGRDLRQGMLVCLMWVVLVVGVVVVIGMLGSNASQVEAGNGAAVYQYKVVKGCLDSENEGTKGYTKYLNQHAKDGWRLHTAHMNRHATLIFERKK